MANVNSTSPTKVSMEQWKERDDCLREYPVLPAVANRLSKTVLDITGMLSVDVHLYNQLEAKEVLTHEEIEDLQTRATNPDRVRQLLYVLRHRSLWHYRGFLACLEDGLNLHVIGALPAYDDLFNDMAVTWRPTEPPIISGSSDDLKYTTSVATQTEDTLPDLSDIRSSEFDIFAFFHAYLDRRMCGQKIDEKHVGILNTLVYGDMTPDQLVKVVTCKYMNMKKCKPLAERVLQILYTKLYSEPELAPGPTAPSIAVVSGGTEGGQPIQYGMAARLTPSGHLEEFTPLTRDSEITRYDVRTVGSTCVAHLGFIFLFGGKPTLRGVSLSKSWLYSPARDVWTSLPNMSTPRTYFSAHVLPSGRYILAVGGVHDSTSMSFLSSCERFDLVTRTWSTRAAMFSPRFCYAGAVCDGLLYVTGGTYEQSGHSNSVCVYSEAWDSWSDAPAMLEARASHVAGAVPGRVVVCGGRKDVQRHRINVMTVEVFSVAAQQWTLLSRLSLGTLDAQPVTWGGYLYVVGGCRYDEEGEVGILRDVTRVDMTTGEAVVERVALPVAAQETAVCVVPLPLASTPDVS